MDDLVTQLIQQAEQLESAPDLLTILTEESQTRQDSITEQMKADGEES